MQALSGFSQEMNRNISATRMTIHSISRVKKKILSLSVCKTRYKVKRSCLRLTLISFTEKKKGMKESNVDTANQDEKFCQAWQIIPLPAIFSFDSTLFDKNISKGAFLFIFDTRILYCNAKLSKDDALNTNSKQMANEIQTSIQTWKITLSSLSRECKSTHG